MLQDGRSALWWASNAGETECVMILLKHEAQVDLPVRCDIQKGILNNVGGEESEDGISHTPLCTAFSLCVNSLSESDLQF